MKLDLVCVALNLRDYEVAVLVHDKVLKVEGSVDYWIFDTQQVLDYILSQQREVMDRYKAWVTIMKVLDETST